MATNNMHMVKVISIWLKTAEIVVLVAATGTIGNFLKEVYQDAKERNPQRDPYDGGLYGRFEFFLFATACGVIIAIAGLVLFLIGFFEKNNEKNNGALIAMITVNALWAQMLLVSTALLTKVLMTYQKTVTSRDHIIWSLCDNFHGGRNYDCSHMTGGEICGYIGTVLYLFDTLIAYLASKQATHSLSDQN